MSIERKFLINPHFSIEEILMGKDVETSNITQAYLMSEQGKHLRVRKENYNYTMCYSQKVVVFGPKPANNDYEFKIPDEYGEELINLTNKKFEKIRHSFQIRPGVSVNLDVFEDLSIAWVEYVFDSINILTEFEFPKWVGRNISDSKIFNNIAIAKGEFL